ncbi:hypothetical protein BO71DRAFT_285274, partial [Aspergillus ellipticus CBS 707.79]
SVHAKDGNGLTALHWAVQGSKFNERILTKNGNWLTIEDGWERTLATMKFLMELHADINVKDVNGRTPLCYAAARGIQRV